MWQNKLCNLYTNVSVADITEIQNNRTLSHFSFLISVEMQFLHLSMILFLNTFSCKKNVSATDTTETELYPLTSTYPVSLLLLVWSQLSTSPTPIPLFLCHNSLHRNETQYYLDNTCFLQRQAMCGQHMSVLDPVVLQNLASRGSPVWVQMQHLLYKILSKVIINHITFQFSALK